MTLPAGFLALLPGQSEWLVLLVIGLLLFGRRLPEVGRAIGKTVADFRRGMEDFKREVDKDGSLSEAKASIQDLKKAVDAPRIATDPRRMFKKLTDDALSTPSRPDQDQPPEEPPSDSESAAKQE